MESNSNRYEELDSSAHTYAPKVKRVGSSVAASVERDESGRVSSRSSSGVRAASNAPAVAGVSEVVPSVAGLPSLERARIAYVGDPEHFAALRERLRSFGAQLVFVEPYLLGTATAQGLCAVVVVPGADATLPTVLDWVRRAGATGVVMLGGAMQCERRCWRALSSAGVITFAREAGDPRLVAGLQIAAARWACLRDTQPDAVGLCVLDIERLLEPMFGDVELQAHSTLRAVATLMSLGMRDAEIASQLDVAPRTAKEYAARVERRLELVSRAGFARVALAAAGCDVAELERECVERWHGNKSETTPNDAAPGIEFFSLLDRLVDHGRLRARHEGALGLALLGLANKEICALTGSTLSAAKDGLAAARKRLNVRSRYAVLRRAAELEGADIAGLLTRAVSARRPTRGRQSRRASQG